MGEQKEENYLTRKIEVYQHEFDKMKKDINQVDAEAKKERQIRVSLEQKNEILQNQNHKLRNVIGSLQECIQSLNEAVGV